MDFADRVTTADLQQNAIVLATFAWQAAMRGPEDSAAAPRHSLIRGTRCRDFTCSP
jgi:hypothetical protein